MIIRIELGIVIVYIQNHTKNWKLIPWKSMKNWRKLKKFETVRTVLRSQETISTAPILSNLQKIITNSNKIQIEFCKRLTCLIFSILSNKNNSRNEITIIFHENFTNINQSSNNTQYNMIPSKNKQTIVLKSKFLASKSITMALRPVVGNYFTRILDLLTSMLINTLNMNFLKRWNKHI